jgi:cytoskeletal protein RodZ
MLNVLRPAWVPVAGVAGVAAVLIVVVSSGAVTTADTANTDEVAASKPTAPVLPVTPEGAPVITSPALAVAPEPEQNFPAPDMHEAEIERIEFGGKNGRIGTIEGKRGTTTVIWVSDEDAGPGQRSL